MNKRTLFITICLIILLAMQGNIFVNAKENQLSTYEIINENNSQIPPEQSRTGPTPPIEVVERDLLRSPQQGYGEVLLNNVPAYAWRHGCGPTALGMVVGYYNDTGFQDLILGDATTQTEFVNQAIASGGDINDPRPSGSEEHFENYALPIDNFNTGLLDDDYITNGREPHFDNSIADFMDTSKSSRNNYYGWSWSSDMGPSFEAFVRQRNYRYQPSYNEYFTANGTMNWSVLTNEIDEGRPMVFLVDSSGNGSTDHFVTVIGYRTSPTLQYASWDTWSTTEVRWEDFAVMAPGIPWGINRGWTFDINLLTFDCSNVVDVSEDECEALVSFYNHTNGDEWIDNSNWLESNYVSNWYGVEVLNNHVDKLHLQSNDLSGSLPSHIGDLSELTRLHLEFNNLGGKIPPQLGDLAKLEILFLSGNWLSGSIPNALTDLSNLTWLHLNMNNLSGVIPSDIGNLSSLYWLNLWGNQLSGELPASLGSIPNLERIELSHNNLSGSIPNEIGFLSNLEILQLQNNILSGNIPESFTNLNNLCTPSDPCSSFMFYGEYGLNLGHNRFNVPATPVELEMFLAEKDPNWAYTQAKSQVIDQDGGELTSYMGDVVITVAEGTLNSETEFFIEPNLFPSYYHGQLNYAGSSFRLTAKEKSTNQQVNFFDPPVTIKIMYDESTLGNISEDSLGLYYFHFGDWEWKDAVTTCIDGEYIRNKDENWFLVPVCHFSEFAVFGEKEPVEDFKIFLPLVLN